MQEEEEDNEQLRLAAPVNELYDFQSKLKDWWKSFGMLTFGLWLSYLTTNGLMSLSVLYIKWSDGP